MIYTIYTFYTWSKDIDSMIWIICQCKWCQLFYFVMGECTKIRFLWIYYVQFSTKHFKISNKEKRKTYWIIINYVYWFWYTMYKEYFTFRPQRIWRKKIPPQFYLLRVISCTLINIKITLVSKEWFQLNSKEFFQVNFNWISLCRFIKKQSFLSFHL